MGDTIGFRQQLSMISFEARELEITVNYFSVYTWTENGSFMGNLTSWPMHFWLVLLIEHKVQFTATRQTRSTAAWLRDNCVRIPPQQNHHMAAATWPPLLSGYSDYWLHLSIIQSVQLSALLRAQTTGVSHDTPVSGLSACLSHSERSLVSLCLLSLSAV